MKISIITIGDELLLGQVTDVNSTMIARAVAPYGWEVVRSLTIGDDAAAITDAVEDSLDRASIVITTGGLGPTKDDITKRVMLTIFGGRLVRNEEALANARRIFEAKGLDMNRLTESQADVPSSCRVIQNRVGTAPVMWFERDGGRNVLVSLPGVPSEAKEMFCSEVLPQLLQKFASDVAIEHRTAICYGVSESALATHLDQWETALPAGVHLAYLPDGGIIRLRLDATASSAPAAKALADGYFAQLKEHVAQWLAADADLSPAEILLGALKKRHLTVATAESCTGGNIAHCLTLIPGSSDAMMGGVVAYSNSVKQSLLGVRGADIARHGAVSETVAAQMAEGVCRATGASLGISTSGIAGPGGGSPQKPVGTVCIGVSLLGHTVSLTRHFGGTSRAQIIQRATNAAIMLAVQQLRNS